MIDEKVKLIAADFGKRWSQLFVNFPQYQLDFSWPSVAVLDYILFALRGKEKLIDQERILVEASAAYLACVIHDCWKLFPDKPSISVSLIEEPSIEIVLRAGGGDHLAKDTFFVVPLVKTLISVCTAPKHPFPCFAKTSIALTPETNVISAFATGLLGGISPYGKGGWAEVRPEAFSGQLNTAAKFAAESTAKYHERLFPLDELGALKELYFSHLIFPPPGYDEKLPYSRATAGILHYLKSIEASDEQILKLAEHLVRLPHDLPSALGFVIGAVVGKNTVPVAIRAYAELHPLTAYGLYPNITIARQIFSNTPTWLELWKEGKIVEASAAIELDYELGLLPLKYFDDLGRLTDNRLDLILNALMWSSASGMRDLLSIYTVPRQVTLSLFLQQTFLDFIVSDFAHAECNLTAVSELMPPKESKHYFRYWDLKGLLHEMKQEFPLAKQALQEAFAAGSADLIRLARVGEILAQRYSGDGDLERAIEVLTAVVSKNPAAIPARLRYCLLLHERRDEERLDAELGALVQLAPNSPQVFSLLKDILLLRQGAIFRG